MKTFKFSLVLRTRESTDVFITLDENIYGIHKKRVNILYILQRVKERKAGNLFAMAQSSPHFGWGHTECIKID